MMMGVKKQNARRQQGQAIFEFIVFLPFLLLVLFSVVHIGAAINGSINQQKAVRGYFYNLVEHDSMLPSSNNISDIASRGVKHIGFWALGWQEKQNGESPVAPCYRMPLFGKAANQDSEECETPQDGRDRSQFIRVYTMYGVCGEDYDVNGSEIKHVMSNVHGEISASCSLIK